MLHNVNNKFLVTLDLAEFLTDKQKENFEREILPQIDLAILQSWYSNYFLKLKEVVPFSRLKPLLQPVVLQHPEIAAYFYEEDPQWVLPLNYSVEILCKVAKRIFKKDPKGAEELINVAKMKAQYPRDFNNIACAYAEVDDKKAEHYYELAIQTSIERNSHKHENVEINFSLKELGKLNLDKYLSYVESSFPSYQKYNFCFLGAYHKDWALYKKGIDSIFFNESYNDPEWTYTLLCSKSIHVFGTDMAIEQAYNLAHVHYRIVELLKISRRILPSDPQRALELAKDAIALSLSLENPDDKIKSLFHFIVPKPW